MRALALLAGASLALLLAAVACDDATKPPFLAEISPLPSPTATSAPAPTPTAAPETPTPEGECDGMDCFRAFAPLIDAALADGDGAFFAGRGLEEELTCQGDEQLGPCVDQPAGTVLTGIPGGVAQSDAIFYYPPDQFAFFISQWFRSDIPAAEDEYGSGALTLYALAYHPAAEGSEEAYQAIVTGMFSSGPDALRQALVLSFRFVDGSWRLTGQLQASIPQTADPYLSGDCTDCYDQWERWEGAP